MKKIQLLSGIIALLLLVSGCGNQREIEELLKENAKLKQELSLNNRNEYLVGAVLWDMHSPEMTAVCLEAYGFAKRILPENIANMRDKTKKPVVITDIDETVLSNSLFDGWLCRSGTAYNDEDWDKWCLTEQAPMIEGSLDFMKYAESLGCEIFYVSNRCGEKVKTATINNLRKFNFPFADSVHVILKEDGTATGREKTGRRKTIEQRFGGEIVMLCGDQVGDFATEFELSNNYSESELKKLVRSHASEFGTKYIIIPNPQYSDWCERFTNKDKTSALGLFNVKNK